MNIDGGDTRQYTDDPSRGEQMVSVSVRLSESRAVRRLRWPVLAPWSFAL
jgi:hypothetical protein